MRRISVATHRKNDENCFCIRRPSDQKRLLFGEETIQTLCGFTRDKDVRTQRFKVLTEDDGQYSTIMTSSEQDVRQGRKQ